MKRRSCRKPKLRRRKTDSVELFRTTPTNTVCPNFYVLAHANGCLFSPRCSYCYLKSSFWYLKEDVAFVNIPAIEQEIRNWIAGDGYESYVLNSGNLSDSLSFEESRPLIARLVELFRAEAEEKGRPHSLLLVTKGGTRESAPLFETEPCDNIIVSFSINTPEAAAEHEKGAAPSEDRIEAARRLGEQGWRVRVRIDPMILGYDYGGLAGRVRELAPERVTLGTLRAGSHLLRCVGNGIFEQLEKPSEPRGLARYPLAERLALYRQAVEPLRDLCPIGLCEETPDVWKALGLDADSKPCNCGL
jgi:spore photoproduct lyase